MFIIECPDTFRQINTSNPQGKDVRKGEREKHEPQNWKWRKGVHFRMENAFLFLLQMTIFIIRMFVDFMICIRVVVRSIIEENPNGGSFSLDKQTCLKCFFTCV